MLHKNKTRFYCTLFFFLFYFFAIPPAMAENVFIRFYQEHISPVDGNRCPMYPSCSSYALQAIEKHGPILGVIMSCDRLVRCGRDEADSPSSIIKVENGQEYVYDPVEANDFWWFEKKQ